MPGDKGFEIGDFPHPESLQWDEENTNRKDVQLPIENSVLTDSGCSGSSITHTEGPGHKKKVIGGIILVIGTALAIAVGVSMGRGTTTDTVSAANTANTHDHGHSKSQKSKGIDFVKEPSNFKSNKSRSSKSCKEQCADINNGCIFIEVKDQEQGICKQTCKVLATGSDIIDTMMSISNSASGSPLTSDQNDAFDTSLEYSNGLSNDFASIESVTSYIDFVNLVAASSIPSATSIAFSKTVIKEGSTGSSYGDSIVLAQQKSIASIEKTALDVNAMLVMGIEAFSSTAQQSVEKYKVSLQQTQERLLAISKAHITFLGESLVVPSTAKESALIDFRNLCSNSESSDITPADIFFNLYGFGCGVPTGERLCNGQDTGTCPHGITKGISLNLLQSDIYDYGTWLLSTMASSMYLYSTCLPPTNVDTSCTTENSLSKKKVLLKMQEAFVEVASNIGAEMQCVKAGTPQNNNVIACVVDDVTGSILSPGQANYASGTITTIPITKEEAFDETVDVVKEVVKYVDILAKVTDTLGSTLASAFPKFGAALGAAASILNLASFFMGQDVEDPTQALIKSEFVKTNAKIDQLGETITSQFKALTRLTTDIALDEIMANLDRISRAFVDYTSKDANLPELRSKYTSQFRYACNELAYRPEDILLFLYGHLCGDADWDNDRCESKDGESTGTCKFGKRKKSYFLDVYRKSDNDDPDNDPVSILELRNFQQWIGSAMAEALFLQAVCLPLDEDSCPTAKDPVFQKNLENSKGAYLEAMGNLVNAEDCNCPCKRVSITKVRETDGTDGGLTANGFAEAAIFVDELFRWPKEKDVFNSGCNVYGQVPLKGEKVLSNPIVIGTLTTAQSPSHKLRVEEYDSFDGFDNALNSGADIESRNVSPSDLEIDQNGGCANYVKDISTDNWRFTYKIDSLPPSECPPGFCSPARPDCPTDFVFNLPQYCDLTKTQCTNKKEKDEDCETDGECLSGECSGVKCTTQFSAGEECTSDFQCLNASIKNSFAQYKCVELEGGSRCNGKYADEACADNTQCFTNNCNNNKCIGQQKGGACDNDFECATRKCTSNVCAEIGIKGVCNFDVQCESKLCYLGECLLDEGEDCTNANKDECANGFCMSDKCGPVPTGAPTGGS